MIKNIVLDMGNVMLYFDRGMFLNRLDVSEEDRALLLREVYVSLEWAQMDRGTLDEPEAVKKMCARLPERLWDAADRLTAHWQEPVVPMEGMAELVRELKSMGCGLYLLSNASHMQHRYWPEVPGAECFDGTLISADVCTVKPQPEIYAMLCAKYSLRPEECVFIDDSPNNVEGAVFCGMAGIVFHKDAKLLRRELRRMGVMVRE